jgi:UDP-N-acetylglucosamine--N-acetylmuramyl-(pentapeptide) pyrophosphoryl-undecaprenol N-acetylglucosamine transferase
LPELLALAQVFHISGPEDQPALNELAQSLPADLRGRYHLYAYVHEQMTDLLAAADLVVARAGAATLGEFPAVGLPAVLVPYPHAGQHQELNAEYLVKRGAARIVPDRELETRLLPVVRDLLGDERLLGKMGAAARQAAQPDAAKRIAAELDQLALGMQVR